MRPFLVLLSLPLLVLSFHTPLLHHIGPALTDRCQFTLGNQEYDLCPIFNAGSRPIQVERLDPDNTISAVYDFRLSEAPQPYRYPYDRGDAECAAGTWICMIAVEKQQGSRVQHALPIANAPQLETHTRNHATVYIDHSSDGHLNLRLQGKSPGHPYQEALIRLYCDKDAAELSDLSFSGEEHGLHSFIWKSRHACASPRPLAYAADGTDDASTSPDDTKDKGDQELVDPTANVPRSSRLLIIILLPGVALVIIGAVIYSPPAVLRQWFNAYVKPRKFRVGEIVLVQWAQEEQGMMDDEEGVMVNAHEDVEAHSEYIPLKPSPRRNAYYGSTRRGDRVRYP